MRAVYVKLSVFLLIVSEMGCATILKTGPGEFTYINPQQVEKKIKVFGMRGTIDSMRVIQGPLGTFFYLFGVGENFYILPDLPATNIGRAIGLAKQMGECSTCQGGGNSGFMTMGSADGDSFKIPIGPGLYQGNWENAVGGNGQKVHINSMDSETVILQLYDTERRSRRFSSPPSDFKLIEEQTF